MSKPVESSDNSDLECQTCGEKVSDLYQSFYEKQCDQCYFYCECGASLFEAYGSMPGDGFCRKCD